MLCQLSYARSNAQLIERCDGLPDYFNGMFQLQWKFHPPTSSTIMGESFQTGK